MAKPTLAEIEQLRIEREAALAEEAQAREAMSRCLGNRGFFGRIPFSDEERAIYQPYYVAYKAARAQASAAIDRHFDAIQRYEYGDENGTIPERPLGADDDQGTLPSEYHRYSGPEAASILGISDSRLYRLARRRGLGRQVGGVWLYTAADIAAMRERPSGKAGQAYYRRLREREQQRDDD